MDKSHTKRLDFTKMVDKHIQGKGETKYFNAIEMHSDKPRAAMKEPQDHEQIQNKVNRIVSHVYAQLREQKRTFVPTKLPATQNKVINTEKGAQTIPERPLPNPSNRKETLLLDGIYQNPKSSHKGRLSIPRLKVLCKRKEQKRLHHTIPPEGDENNFVNQKRISKIKKQNALLESMLANQKQLQRERKSVAQEIVTIRNQLDAIWGRLDSSFKKLKQNKTFVGSKPLKSLKPLP